METEIKLSIIILSWNTRDLLKQCLESVIEEAKTIDGGEIIVVDNGSTDGSVELVESLSSDNNVSSLLKLKVIQNKENLGFAKGNNIGIKEARGDYIMLLNSDTIVKKGSLRKLLSELYSRQDIAIIGPKLLNIDGTPQPNCGHFPTLPVVATMLFKEHFGGSNYVRSSPRNSGFVDWLMGAAFLARREVFDKIGGLDEKFFMYMEEVEWFYRAAKAGFKAYFLKEAEVVHFGRGSSKSGKKEPILNIYRGIIYFYKKHKTFSELLILRLMLKAKAVFALILGYLKNDNYLKQTYGEAFKIN